MARSPIIIPGDIARRTRRIAPYPGAPISRGRGAEFIPDFYKDFEVFDKFIRLIELVAPTFDTVKAAALSIPDLVSPDRVDPQFFYDLARLLDFGFDEDVDIEVQRKELLKTVDAYLIRGSAPSATRIARMLGADKAFVFTPFEYVKFLDTTRSILSGGYRFEEIDFWRWGTYEVAARHVDFTKLLPKIKSEVHPAGTVVFGRLITDLIDEEPPDPEEEIGLRQTKIYVIEEDYTSLTVSMYSAYVDGDNPSGYWKLDESPDLAPSSGVPLIYGGLSRPANDAGSGTATSPSITHPNTNPVAYGRQIEGGILLTGQLYEAHYTYRNTNAGETHANVTPASVTLTGTQNALIVTYPKAAGVTNATSVRLYVAKGNVAIEKLVAEDFLTADPAAWSTGAFHNIGDRIKPSTGSYYHICVKSGFSGVTEPIWSVAAPAQITTDNEVQWFSINNTDQALIVLSEAAIYGAYKYGTGVDGVPAFDASGHNLTGQYLDGVTRGRPGALTSGVSTAALFDGNLGRVKLPVSSLLKPGTGNFSIEAWVKAVAGVSGVAVGTRWNNGNTTFQLRITFDGYAEFSVWNSPDSYPATNHVLLLTAMRIDLDENDQVSDWPDSVGSNNFSQSSVTRRPLFREESDTPSKRPSLRFDGINDRLPYDTTLALSTTHALVIHFKCTAISTANMTYALLGCTSASPGGYVRYNHSLTTPSFEYRAGSSNNCFATLTSPLVKDRWYTLIVDRNGTSVTFYLDGVQVNTTQTMGGNANFNLRYVGAEQTAIANPFAGEIDEVLAYSAFQGSTNVAAIQAKIDAKYNVVNSGRLATFTSPLVMTDGEWHHYACVIDATNSMALFYIDTNKVGMSAYTVTNLDPGTNPFRIGSRTTTSGHFNGEVDEVAIYQSALSRNSISTHFHSALGSIVSGEYLTIKPFYRMSEQMDLFATTPFRLGFSKLGSADLLGSSTSLLEGITAWVDPPNYAAGKALTVTANNQYVSFPSNSRVNTALNSNAFTLELRLYLVGGAASGDVWGPYGTTNVRALRMWATNMEFVAGGASPTVITSSTYAINTYQHWIITYDGTTVRMYKNGSRTPVSSAAYTFAGAFTGAYSIGASGTSCSNFRVDEVRVYSRTISAKEVEDHYNGVYLNETALEAWYSFDASSVVDNGPNGINGTANNGPTYTATSGVGVRPVYAGVTPGQVVAAEVVGTGNGATTTFTPTLSRTNVIPYSVRIVTSGGVTARDNGSGTLTGTGIGGGSTINYSTGAVNITFTVAPPAGSITADYWVKL